MSDPVLDWRKTVKRRVVAATALFALWAVGIEVRLVQLQIFRRSDLATRASRQQMQTRTVPDGSA